METAQVKLTRRKLKGLLNDGIKTAAAINLVYVNDTQPGITRSQEGEKFIYKLGRKTITAKKELDRIRRLVIPPAWLDVWICPIPNGHLQVTGKDQLGRKQYKYHPLWNELRNHSKYSQLVDFGKALPQIRERLQKDLALPGMPQEKILAAAVSIMQCTCIRVGNSEYEKLYGSFGLTTLKNRHVKVNGQEVLFSFKGKKGVYHNVALKSRKLANIIQKCLDIPGKELFQYLDDEGERKAIDSGMINAYIKQISGGNFTAKDFRTWAGSLHALTAFKEIGTAEKTTEIKKNMVQALDVVAKQLGNTRTVCKKYYVHPSILDHYSNNTLGKYLDKIDKINCTDSVDLNSEEQVLMKILESSSVSVAYHAA
jgi:DNA topoisomerase-1